MGSHTGYCDWHDRSPCGWVNSQCFCIAVPRSILGDSTLQWRDLHTDFSDSQALRGAGPSFGIVTQFTFQTLPAPEISTFFNYNWQVSADQATQAILLYQNFSLSPSIPGELGFELNVFRGDNEGGLRLQLLGTYYGPPDQFVGMLDPFLDAMVRLIIHTSFSMYSYETRSASLARASHPRSIKQIGSKTRYFSQAQRWPAQTPAQALQ